MLTLEARNKIAVDSFNLNNKKHVVILDQTGNFNDVGVADLKESDFLVVRSSNAYNAAVKSANFWDERQNTWLVSVDDNMVEEVSFFDNAVESLTVFGFDCEFEGSVKKRFNSLSAEKKLDIYFSAAMKRIR